MKLKERNIPIFSFNLTIITKVSIIPNININQKQKSLLTNTTKIISHSQSFSQTLKIVKLHHENTKG